MQGLPGDDTEGLIPRSIKKILEVTKGAAREGWQYTLEASFLEIYNEVRVGVALRAAFDVVLANLANVLLPIACASP